MVNSMSTNLITFMKWTSSLETQLAKTHTRKRYTLVYIKETESTINNLSELKASSTGGFTGEFYLTFKEEIIFNCYNIFQRIEVEGILPNSF